MTQSTASPFPAIRRFCSGYLHEDALSDAGTPETALRTFWSDASPAERRRFQREAARLLAHAAALDLAGVRDLVQQLGGRWVPPSRDAFVALFASASTFDAPPRP